VRKLLEALALCALVLPVHSMAQAPGAQPSPQQVVAAPTESELASFMDAALAAQRKAYPIAGVAVSVVGDGRILFARGYGFSDVEKRTPVDPQRTLFRIGSISKLFTWTAVMQLAEQNRLDLDADVNRYLDFKLPEAFGAPITLRHLLSHTAGFEDRGVGTFQTDPARLQSLGTYLGKNIPARVRPPGQAPAYSNYGAALAGYIVERVSGLPFDTYVERYIYAPLGMRCSTFREPLPADFADHAATGYTFAAGRFVPKGFEYIHNIGPAGSMSSTATDMARFMLAHLSAGRGLFSPTTAEMMSRRLFANHPALPAMAHGFFELRTAPPRAIGHGGNTDLFQSNLVLVPERGLGLFVSYTGGSQAVRASREIVSLFLDRFAPSRKDVGLVATNAAAAEEYAGTYRTDRHSYTTLEKVSVFGSDVTVAQSGGDTLTTDAFGDAQLWAPVSKDLYRWVSGGSPVGELGNLAFLRDASGQVTGFALGASPYTQMERIGYFATSSFAQLVLVVSCLVFVAVLMNSLWHLWKRGDDEGRPLRLRRLLAGAAAALNLVFLWLMISTITGLAESGTEMPSTLAFIFSLPLLALLLTACVLVLVIRQWQQGSRDRWLHLAFMLAALLFAATLAEWNLLGFRY
jgi:CubicO group peptidase (beta-lactamase class C family)